MIYDLQEKYKLLKWTSNEAISIRINVFNIETGKRGQR